MLNSLYSNFTANVDSALLFLPRKNTRSQEIYLCVSFHGCHLASSAEQISWAQSREFFSALHLTRRTWV